MVWNKRQQANSNVLNCIAAFLSCHFISLALLSQSTSSSYIGDCCSTKQFKEESDRQNDRITVLENQNRHQDEEIQFLKSKFSELNRNGVKNYQVNDGIVDDVTSSDTSARKRHHQKRPAQMNQLALVMGTNSISGTIVPSTCDDLSQIGYTLNGFYLVKGRNGSKTIDTVYCNFQMSGTEQRSLSPPTVSENRIGYVDIKSSSGVYFYAFSQNGRVANSGTLLFDKSYLNIGNAMDTSTGVFTAPKSGIYHFSFSVLKEGYGYTGVSAHLRLNENKLGVVHVGDGLFSSQGSLQSTLKLKKGDRIDVWIAQGKIHEVHKRSNHFTGWLLEEYLEY